MGNLSPRSRGWMYRQRRPADDDGYFENMTRVIFQAGLSWEIIGNKWPSFKKAFASFAVDKVAKFDDANVSQLMANASIVRNKRKIEATISNAKEFQRIRSLWGSFQSYLSSLDKSQNFSHVIKELRERFQHLGSSSARIFLYSVGENVDHPEEG